jgi:hypothetical protein
MGIPWDYVDSGAVAGVSAKVTHQGRELSRGAADCVFLFIACVASAIGATSGIGGGIIIRPVLDAFSGQGIAEINVLSGSTVLAMSLVSLLRSRGSGIVLEHKKGTARPEGPRWAGRRAH